MPQPSATEISLKITYLNFCSNLPGANESDMILYGACIYNVATKGSHGDCYISDGGLKGH